VRSISRWRPTSGSIAPLAGELGQVLGVGGERLVGGCRLCGGLVVLAGGEWPRLPGPGVRARTAARRARVGLRNAVRQVADHVEPRHPLLLEQGDGEALAFGVEGNEEVRPLDGAPSRALDLGGGAGERALQRQRQPRLEHPAVLVLALERLSEVLLEAAAHPLRIAAGVAQHARGLVVQGERVEQVLGAGVLVPQPPGLGDGDGQRDLHVLRELHRCQRFITARVP
jgi:hypothetical protein